MDPSPCDPIPFLLRGSGEDELNVLDDDYYDDFRQSEVRDDRHSCIHPSIHSFILHYPYDPVRIADGLEEESATHTPYLPSDSEPFVRLLVRRH